jgi:hypothetical protein
MTYLNLEKFIKSAYYSEGYYTKLLKHFYHSLEIQEFTIKEWQMFNEIIKLIISRY